MSQGKFSRNLKNTPSLNPRRFANQNGVISSSKINRFSIMAADEAMRAFYGDEYYNSLVNLDVRKNEWLSKERSRDIWMVGTQYLDVKSFKGLGAANLIREVVEEAISQNKKQVMLFASSEGNHAQGVASAVREVNRVLSERNIDMDVIARIYMSTNADDIKVNRTRAFGTVEIEGKRIEKVKVIQIEGESYDVARLRCEDDYKHTSAKGAHCAEIPPFNHPSIIIGAATQAIYLEKFFKDKGLSVPKNIVTGISGGGLTCGFARYFRGKDHHVIAAGTSAYPNTIFSSLMGGDASLQIRKSMDDPHAIAVGGSSVLRSGDVTARILHSEKIPIYTAHPEQLAWMLDYFVRKELKIKGGIKEYVTLDDSVKPSIPELAGLMSLTVDVPGKGSVLAYITGGNISDKKAKDDIEYIQNHTEHDPNIFPKMDTPFYDPKNRKGSLESIKGTIKTYRDGKEIETNLLDPSKLEELEKYAQKHQRFR